MILHGNIHSCHDYLTEHITGKTYGEKPFPLFLSLEAIANAHWESVSIATVAGVGGYRQNITKYFLTYHYSSFSLP